MKSLIFATILLCSHFLKAEDTWTWMISGGERLIVQCHQRGVDEIKSFNAELELINRTTGEKGCEVFDVVHVMDQENTAIFPNIHVNATIYGLDRLKRSPSTLIDWSLIDMAIYPIKLLAIRAQTKRLGKKLTRFLEHGEFPKTEKVSREYFERFIEEAQITIADFLTLSK